MHSYGKVEFCLPTKLQVPHANISNVRARALDDALNAFGLFARLTVPIPLDNAIAMFMLVRWGISNIGSRSGSLTRTRLTSKT